MSESSKRPPVLTVFCWLVILVCLFRTAVVIWAAPSLGPLRVSYALLHKILAIVAIIGMLRLQRWGVYLYLGAYAASVGLYFVWPPADRLPTALVLVSAAIALTIFGAVTFPFWDRFSGYDLLAEERRSN